MPTTPLFDLPYPVDADSPNGPLQIQQLAQAVEAIRQPYVGVSRAANQLIPDLAWTDVTYPTENSDVDAFHAANSASLIVPAGMGGVYLVAAKADWEAKQGGFRWAQFVTTGGVILGGGMSRFRPSDSTSANAQVTHNLSALVALSAGDSVKMQVQHTWVGTPNGMNIATASLAAIRLGAE